MLLAHHWGWQRLQPFWRQPVQVLMAACRVNHRSIGNPPITDRTSISANEEVSPSRGSWTRITC